MGDQGHRPASGPEPALGSLCISHAGLMNSPLFYFQSPVGNRSHAALGSASHRGNGASLASATDRRVSWYDSGTMALAAAVSEALARKPALEPKVVVPAYGCPDLVAALRYAGAEPLYVDLAPDSTVMDIAQLAAVVDRAAEEIVAIIGVDLFGLAEQWSDLARIAGECDAFLIQDSAQSVMALEAYPAELHGDAVVFSFGRGKPVCCLTGGALLTGGPPRDGDGAQATVRDRSVAWLRFRNTLYNALIRPQVYSLLARVMGERLGATRYVPLTGITTPDEALASVLEAALARYWAAHADSVSSVDAVVRAVTVAESTARVRNPGNLTAASGRRRLSRWPLLARSAAARSDLLQRLTAAGISATTMYSRTLPEIVAEHDGATSYERFPNAERFASRLLTLPVHARLMERDFAAMRIVLDPAPGS